MPVRPFSILGALVALLALAPAQAQQIVVASTTSPQESGLFAHILPLFEAKTGIEVRVVAQALDTARRGEADVVPLLIRLGQ